MLPVRVAIIGTAGRNEDADKMSEQLFERMVAHAALTLRNKWHLPNERVVLVSGGSAWADHVAVRLFLREVTTAGGQPYAGLHLYLPCKLVETAVKPAAAAAASSAADAVQSVRFEDTGSWSSPGRTLNELHSEFARKLGVPSTLSDLQQAQSLRAKLSSDARGFFARNKQVAASCQRMIAFTWGSAMSDHKKGGTKHTWDLAKHAQRLHVPLHMLTHPSATPTTPIPAGAAASATAPMPLDSKAQPSSVPLASKRKTPAAAQPAGAAEEQQDRNVKPKVPHDLDRKPH